jgi:DNA-directed RNA polymerase subunit beta'
LLAKTPREVSGTQDITGGLPRVTEIFEARRPKEPAVIAEIDGEIELLPEKRRGKRTIIVKSRAGVSKEHLVPHGKHLRVHGGDYVRAGDPLVEGPQVPHDILRISGEEAVQLYLLREIQSVYRSQSVDIDDKHIEIIIAQMLRKVRVETGGDTTLLPGSVIDKFQFRNRNGELAQCVKIVNPGDTEYKESAIVPKEIFEQENARIEATGGKSAKWNKPTPATASTQLLGITKAAVQSDSFISAASFQETTKVLTEAALAGKVDRLVGLKENVILGHLVPAGTGFKAHQESEVRIRPEALESLAAEHAQTWAASALQAAAAAATTEAGE